MMKMGEDGYVQCTKKVVAAARQLADGISSIEHLELCCPPDAMVVAWSSTKLNIYAISDEMTKRGWNLNALQNPPAVHVCVTLPVSDAIAELLADLKESVAIVLADPTPKKDGMGAIYGMAASIPDKSLVTDITKGYLDALTKL
jgi:sphinganine-1-phosphate aldolase